VKPFVCIALVSIALSGCVSDASRPPSVNQQSQPTPASPSPIVVKNGFFEILETNIGGKSRILPDPDNPSQNLLLNRVPVVAAQDIQSAMTGFSQDGMPIVDIVLTPKGRTSFATFTAQNIRKKLAIVVNDRILSAPLITSPIDGGRVQITGRFTVEEATRIAVAVKESGL
jgi:preprotein translocase subunit SecD